jgi:hypothetical protein
MATLPSPDSPSDSLSATDPVLKTDGIVLERLHLPREQKMEEILRTARQRQHVVIGSPPATGKTSLLQLIRHKLRSQGANVIRMSLRDVGVDSLSKQLENKGIVNDYDELEKIRNTWLLLDDAQSVYDSKYFPLWQFLVKDIASADVGNNLFVIIAATHDLGTPTSPVQLKDIAHVSPSASKDEARQLFQMHAAVWKYDSWDQYENTLLSLCNLTSFEYHLGVVIAGVRLLDEARKDPGRRGFDESRALSLLRSEHFMHRLDRCFQLLDDVPDEARNRILDIVLSGSQYNVVDDETLADFIRAGLLDQHGEFSNLAARWYYNRRCFPSRSTSTPDSLDDLVTLAVRSLSAKRLRDTLEDGFPKEATFQHLFNESMSIHLPLRHYIIPEFNTFATNSAGDVVTGELDFYLNGDLQWCLELLRLGDKIGEHIARFDEYVGKYREVASKSYLVVDCQGPRKGSGVQKSEARCTLYFAEDFNTCVCSMRMRPEFKISLAL